MSFVEQYFIKTDTSHPSRGLPLRVSASSLLKFPFYVAVAILMVNAKVGGKDGSGMNIMAIMFRSEVWIAVGLIMAIFIIPKSIPTNKGQQRRVRDILYIAPLLFIFFTILATTVSGFYGESISHPLGRDEFIRTLMCTGLSIVIYKIAISDHDFGHTLISILIWSPIANIIVGVIVLTTSINHIPGFNEGFNMGFMGIGARFQGLGNNPNIALTQTSIALALLLPRLVQPSSLVPRWEKMALGVYAILLCMLMIWTGTRAVLVMVPVMFIMLFWLRFRLTRFSNIFQQGNNLALLFILIIMIPLLWAGSVILEIQESLLERMAGGLEQSSTGRLFLWKFYFNQLMQNPMGFGLGFENIIETYELNKAGDRLPPHNAFLQAGVYAGIGGVLVSVYLILRIGCVFAHVKRYLDRSKISGELMGVIVAWSSLATSLMFVGMFQSVFSFAVLTALLLALSSQLNTNNHKNFQEKPGKSVP